jgi:hypothetical protein
LARAQRQRRIRCRLPCQVIQRPRQKVAAAVLSLSEGGLGLETTLRVDQGESVRLAIQEHRGAEPVEVEAIVWNRNPAPRARKGERLRILGCVVAAPTPGYLDLVAQLERRNALPEERMSPRRAKAYAKPARSDEDLPRTRVPLPPPKPPPEETLPSFRVRLRQVGGPRTRVVSVQARSLGQAEERARAGLEDAGNWEVVAAAPEGNVSR